MPSDTPAKYGRRNVPKMVGQIDALRQAIRAEGTPAVQSAWDAVEEHIDFAYSGSAHRAGYELARCFAPNLPPYDAAKGEQT